MKCKYCKNKMEKHYDGNLIIHLCANCDNCISEYDPKYDLNDDGAEPSYKFDGMQHYFETPQI